MGYVYLAVATIAGFIETYAGRIRERAGLAYILRDIPQADDDGVVITFEAHPNPDFVVIRGRRGKFGTGLVASRSDITNAVSEIRRTLTAGG